MLQLFHYTSLVHAYLDKYLDKSLSSMGLDINAIPTNIPVTFDQLNPVISSLGTPPSIFHSTCIYNFLILILHSFYKTLPSPANIKFYLIVYNYLAYISIFRYLLIFNYQKILIVSITMRIFCSFKYYSFNKLCITLVASIYLAIDFP